MFQALEDLQLFSPRAYWGLFALENESVWPLHFVVLVVFLLAVLCLLQGQRPQTRWVKLVHGAAWIWTGWHFVALRYGTIHWIVPWAAWGFYAEGILLSALSFAGQFSIERRGVVARAGLGLCTTAVLLWPILALLDGRSWREAEVFVVAPDPTAVFTLGILALFGPWRWRALLCVIPTSWLAFSAFTLFTMGAWQGWVVLAALVVGLAACTLPGRLTTSGAKGW